MIIKEPLCATCKYAIVDENGYATKCKAYPDGIPKIIINSGVDHHEPYKGDHGIQYKRKIYDDYFQKK